MFLIKSTESDASLEFSDLSGDYFKVSLRASSHCATRDVYAYTDAKGIACLFQEAADQWRGWSGTKKWESIEGEFTLELTSDKTGHISLTARINHNCGNPDPWKLEATLTIEAGQLESLAKKAGKYWELTKV